jgi:hypothetical protein
MTSGIHGIIKATNNTALVLLITGRENPAVAHNHGVEPVVVADNFLPLVCGKLC